MPDDRKNDLGVDGPILLVEDDEAIRATVAADLRKLNFEDIEEAGDGAEAWELVRKEEFALVVADWKMPEISGLALLNRIRGDKKNWHLPVLILSGYLAREDFRLLDELPLIAKLEKPYDIGAMASQIKVVMSETAWIAKEHQILTNIVVSMNTDPKAAMATAEGIFRESPRPNLFAIEASRLFIEAGHLTEAEIFLKKIIQSGKSESIGALNMLGKIFLIRGQYQHASVVLEKAHGLCPQNIDRICEMGKAHLNLGDPEKAKAHFETALRLDPSLERAQKGVGVAATLEQYISEHSVDSLNFSFASVMNSIAITKVKSEIYDEGVELYKAALQNVDNPDVQAKLTFNLGLAMLRADKPEDAIPWLQKSVDLSGGTMEKAQRNLEIATAQTAPKKEEPPAPDESLIVPDESLAEPDDFADDLGFVATSEKEGFDADDDFGLSDDFLSDD